MRVTTTLRGSVASAIAASSGLMENIMISTPITVNAAVVSWFKLCCRELAMLSMSLVRRLRISPRVLLS
ncbi:MAG: hypothetical protein BWY85_02306 [Firmicutes bacterium ADurb.Bin506]|nr:MAG: hypothetical protein BWY85_02306 [Firmicutes bacterium ADurb.Bin506]